VRYLWIMLKIQFRIPISVFFSLGFPLLMMFVMMTSFGNIDFGNGYHLIDKYFMMTAGMGMLPLAFITFPMGFGENLENESYKRLAYFGLSTRTMVMYDVLSNFLVMLLGLITNITFAFFMYQLRLPSIEYFFGYIIQSLYCGIVLLMLGALVTLLVKKPQVLQPLGMILMFGSFILSGAMGGNFDMLPEGFQRVGNVLPIKYAMNDFFQIWFEEEVFIQSFLTLNTIWLFALLLLLGGVLMWQNRKRQQTKQTV